MKVIITGGKGMLGRTVMRVLAGKHEFLVADLPEVDILDEDGTAMLPVNNAKWFNN